MARMRMLSEGRGSWESSGQIRHNPGDLHGFLNWNNEPGRYVQKATKNIHLGADLQPQEVLKASQAPTR